MADRQEMKGVIKDVQEPLHDSRITKDDDAKRDLHDTIPDMTSPRPVPVGITIAYKRQQGGFDTIKTERGGGTPRISKEGKNDNKSNINNKESPKSTKTKSNHSGKTQHHHRRIQSSASTGINRNTGQTSRGYTKPIPSFTVFLEGTTLYIICLVLPTLLGLLVRFYDDITVLDWKRDSATIVKARIHSMRHSFHHNVDEICHYQSGAQYYDSSFSFAGMNEDDNGGQNSAGVFGNVLRLLRVGFMPIVQWIVQALSYWFHQSGLCERVAAQILREEEEQYFNHFVVSKDTAYWVQDVSIIVICSMILAALRIWIVQSTVPLEDSTTVEALVRCKSIHLLSSDYAKTMTPMSTPMAIKKTKNVHRALIGSAREEAITPFLLPDLNSKETPTTTEMQKEEVQIPNTLDDSYGDDLGMRWDETEREDEHVKFGTSFSPFMSSNTPLVTHTDSAANIPIAMDDGDTDDEEIVAVSQKQQQQLLEDKIVMSLQSIQSQQQNYDGANKLSFVKPKRSGGVLESTTMANAVASQPVRTRVNAAPRYATALFRLLWSTLSSILALYFFRQSNFWPWYVGGSGSTSNCWDLSGGLSVGGMDSDFDHYNSVLKQYFLGQASYHWHSAAFHVLSMIILLFHPSTKVRENIDLQDEFATHEVPMSPQPSAMRLLFGPSSTAYVRSLAQHVLALALIASAYIFSSLRRLGVIGMFAFDVSNWFLHLLQICMNAPIDSILKQSKVISWVYWLGVIPSFVITRFLVWPLLWYSAVFESQRWLIQLEKTLWIGSATILRCIFHVWMLLIQILNMVYFYRLLHHPHMNNILRDYRKQNNKSTES
jgi:hypothetical protein